MNTTLIIDPVVTHGFTYIFTATSHVREASFSGNVIEQLQALVA